MVLEKTCPVFSGKDTCFGVTQRCGKPAQHYIIYHDDGYENRKSVWFCDQHAQEFRTIPDEVWW